MKKLNLLQFIKLSFGLIALVIGGSLISHFYPNLVIDSSLTSEFYQNKDQEFDQELAGFIEELDSGSKNTFDKLYTARTAQEKGQKYCNSYKEGKTYQEIFSEDSSERFELFSQGIITQEEANNIMLIETMIEGAAINNYCPEYKPLSLQRGNSK